MSSSASAQNTQSAARPDRGLVPGAAYSVSDIESVSLSNGNLNLSIPLASLPPIAGGKLGLTLRATYNSKLWDVVSNEARYRNLTNNPIYVVTAPQPGDRGGWHIGANYVVAFRNAHDDYGYVQTNQVDDPDWQQLQYQYYRAVLVTPDGAEHNLYPTSCTNGGYSGITHNHDYLLGYCKDDPYASGPAKVYYTADGSYISAIITPSVNGPTWTLYMPDGTQVTESADYIQRIRDANGNSIKIYEETDAVTHVKTFHYQDEQSNREIKLTFDASANGGKGQYRAWYQTVEGGWQHIDINMKEIWVKGLIYNTQSWNPEGSENGGGAECTIQAELTPSNAIMPVIDTIIYPATEPTEPGKRYSFGYNSDQTSQVTSQVMATCQSQPQSVTREVSAGLGELNHMETPLGAVVNYTYDGFGTETGPLEFADPLDMARRYVSTKSVTHDETTDTWNYTLSTNGGGGTVQNPDGSWTTQTTYPHDIAYSHYYAMSGKSGLAYRTIESDKVMVERHWTLMPFTNGQLTAPGGFTDHIPFNAVVDAEYTTVNDGNGTNKMSAKTFQYDYNGNLLQTKDYDWFDPSLVSRDNEGVPTGVPAGATLLRTVNNSYYNQATDATSANVYARRTTSMTAPWILSAPQESAVGTSQTRFSYDGQAYGIAPTLGNLTNLSRWDSVTSSWISTATTYDSYGNVSTTTDPKGNVTQIFYEDATHAMPTRVVVDPLNGTGQQTSRTSYDFSTGAVLTRTDPNDAVSSVNYTNQLLGVVDPFGRPGAVYSPAVMVNGTSQRQKTTTTYEDHLRKVTVASDLNAEGDGLLKSRTTADELGRSVLAEQSEDGTNFTISSQTVYEQAGKVIYTSNPTRGDGVATDGWTRSTRDILGRTVEVATFAGATKPTATQTTNSTGKVTTAYDANYVTVTDQAGKVRRSVTNALGQLVRVDEPDSTGDPGPVLNPAQPTSYTYDVLGNLTQVSQGAQTRTFSYSSLSRLTSATNPESGTINYQYDANGNLTQKTDARIVSGSTHVTTTYNYDGLNRVTTRSYNDGTPNVTYAYDTSGVAYSKGRLTSVSSSVSATNYGQFDALGRIRQSSQTTDGQTYQMSYAYNLAGALTSETYPSGRIITTAYDDAGRLSQISGQKTGESNKTYASQFAYTAHGAIKDLKLGNNLWDHTSFNSRLQPTEIDLGTTQGGVDRLKLAYSYGTINNNGNVQSQTITVPTIGTAPGYAVTQSYTYDELNRLKSATEMSGSTQSWKQTFIYDRYGNRTFDTGNTSTGMVSSLLTIDPQTNKHSMPQGSIHYDNAGNLDTDYNGHTFTYDAENKQTKYDGGATVAGGATYAYDGDGHRVKKVTGVNLNTTIFVYDAMGRMVAEYDTHPPTEDGGTSYFTEDNLGTSRIITDADGSVKARHDYLPFGEEVGLSGGRTEQQGYVGFSDKVRQKFTGKERDDETELDYFLARYYSSKQGRFTSPDEFTGGPDELYSFAELASANPTFYASPVNPQSLNKYQYCYNNPLLYVDPNGHQIDAAIEEARNSPIPAVKAAAAAAEAALAVYHYGKTVGFNGEGNAIGPSSFGIQERIEFNFRVEMRKRFDEITAIGRKVVEDAAAQNNTENNSPNQISPSDQSTNYQPNPKHDGPKGDDRRGVSPQPRAGGSLFDSAIEVKAGQKVAVDHSSGKFVVYRTDPNGQTHGYETTWKGLRNEQRAALIKSGLATKRGKIINPQGD